MSERSRRIRKEGLEQLKEGTKKIIKGSGTTKISIGSKPSISHESTGQERYNRLSGVKDLVVGSAKLLFNHDEWWSHYNNANENLANVNLALKKGIPLDGYVYHDSDLEGIPSVAGLIMHLTIPHTNATSSSSAPNNDTWMQAVGKIWNTIRRANAGAVNYGVEDLAKYINQSRNIIAGTAILDRVNALLRTYDQYDASVPAAYFCATGLDYDSFRANAANLANYVELLKIKLETILPLDLDLFKYTYWMFSNVFKESDDAKASEYILAPRWLYSCYGNNLGSLRQISFMGGQSASVTGELYPNIIAAMDQILNDLTSNIIYNIIAGDILKAFGSNAFKSITLYRPDEPVRKVYDEKILTKIQNATIFSNHGFANTYPNTYLDTSGHLTTKLRVERSAFGGSYDITKMLYPLVEKPFINSYKNNNTTTDIISMTRFTLAFGSSATFTTSQSDEYDVSFGTEVVGRCQVVFTQDTSTNLYHFEQVGLGHIIYVSSNNNPSDAIKMWCAMDYAPMTVAYEQTFGNLGQMFDFNNFGRVDKTIMDTFNDIATYSILYVPSLTKVSKAELL